ncbi:MAG: Na(+)-translocating NADH-quinone reductase subunit A [Halobacteriovoraceae bacterium]|nr:Na(+)-translocating NADH-quinone reductase subunit A [Halobacteriovoraceae bacterium]MCB9094075.1 Na(+)-translocating NADH-quinone reductase subunit A [Halobacteriovoraceae bacterium]
MIKLRKGLNLPIRGVPTMQIENYSKAATKIALVGPDYEGMKPTMAVKVGDKVSIGDVLFSDKKTEGVNYCSVASGTVLEINRGEKRVFQSIVIANDGKNFKTFSHYSGGSLDSLNAESVKKLLIESGEWTSLRGRPYSKVADPQNEPHSLFITAMETAPLCADAKTILNHESNLEKFKAGVKVLSKLVSKKVYLCTASNMKECVPEGISNLVHEEFEGPHPAGLVGTHIHFLDPVSSKKMVWHIHYQDVIRIGHLFKTGELSVDEYISLAGPMVKNPRIIKVRRGTSLKELLRDEFASQGVRVVSGSVLNGRKAQGPFDYLGRYHHQVSVIEEGAPREFLGWQKPGLDKFSVTRAFVSAFLPSKLYNFTSSKNGSLRAIVPIGSYEKVMPLDIQPTFLLRSLMARNTDVAQQLGCLELDEEDLALCSFVDPGKNEFGPVLRENLEKIEKDG